MGSEKRLRLGGGRFGKAIDVVMAVAFGMGDADQCAKREVLLHSMIYAGVPAGVDSFNHATDVLKELGLE